MQEMREPMMHATMVAPAPGFTARVMARLAERERARARRRAAVGFGLLVIAVSVPIAIAGLWTAIWVVPFAVDPGMVVTTVLTLSPIFEAIGAVAEAFWVSAAAIFGSVGGVQAFAFALAVLCLTLLWVRVVLGSSQRSLTSLTGGSR